MACGEWIEWKDNMYYLSEGGEMYANGAFTIGGLTYNFDINGALIE